MRRTIAIILQRSKHRSGHMVLTVLLVSVLAWSCSRQSDGPQANEAPAPEPPPASETIASRVVPRPDADYSSFTHDEPQHERLPCLLCHTREKDLYVPKFSGHLPCASCHVQQFEDRNNAICSVCHTDSESGTLKQFPPLSSFTAKFDHGRHLRETDCATCHRPSRSGVALSIPAGRTAHVTCFQCHGPDTEIAGRNIGSCSICHEAGHPVRTSESSPAYAASFSHREHLSRGRTDCSSCHTVLAEQPRGRQVTSPVLAMHFPPKGRQSCGSCHNNKRAFGTGDFANCRRCHESGTFKF